MSLFKTLILVGGIVMLMPREPEKQQEMLARAADGFQWAATYCARNPVQCENAKAGFAAFSERAAFAIKLAFEAAGKGRSNGEPASGGIEPAANQGTLDDGDLQIAWEQPKPKKKKASK